MAIVNELILGDYNMAPLKYTTPQYSHPLISLAHLPWTNKGGHCDKNLLNEQYSTTLLVETDDITFTKTAVRETGVQGLPKAINYLVYCTLEELNTGLWS